MIELLFSLWLPWYFICIAILSKVRAEDVILSKVRAEDVILQ
jgi:hypothetical protein